MFFLISSDCVATSKPATVAFPEVGPINPHRIRIVVDFPAPFGPRNPKISPCRTSIDTRSTATKSPKRFVSSTIRTAGVFCSGCTRRLFLPDQRDEHIFERWQNFLKFEMLLRRQRFHRCQFGVQE